MNKVIFEIGANSGADTEHLSRDGSQVFAFEPSSHLYIELLEKFRDVPNVNILPLAIDIKNSIKHFNVSLEGDKGYGSLYDFSDNLHETEVSIYQKFFTFARKEKVLTMRLDTFMNEYNIESVDYLHIDAQGNDFNCIKSLGNRIKDVKEGRCECTREIQLYKDTDNHYENVWKYLEEVGNFKVEIAYEHPHNSEIDLRFYR